MKKIYQNIYDEQNSAMAHFHLRGLRRTTGNGETGKRNIGSDRQRERPTATDNGRDRQRQWKGPIAADNGRDRQERPTATTTKETDSDRQR